MAESNFNVKQMSRDEMTFIQPYDRCKGLFHVIAYNGRLGRREGLILERSGGATYAAHLIFSFTLPFKRKFVFGLKKNRQEIDDYPNYWMRISWRHPVSEFWPNWFPAWIGKIVGSFDSACGVTGESLL